jgi:hypothetical protein
MFLLEKGVTVVNRRVLINTLIKERHLRYAYKQGISRCVPGLINQ